MMPGSEFVRTGNGQWTKVPTSRLAESILNRSLSRELGLSLRAETINDGNNNFFPPAGTAQRIIAPQPQTVPISSIANNLAEASAIPFSAAAAILKDTDPAQDDYRLFTRSRRPVPPTSSTAEQAKAKTKAPTVPVAAVNIPSLPWGIDGRSKNEWIREPAMGESTAALFAAANRAVMEKSAMKLDRLLRYEAELEKQKAAPQTTKPPTPPVPSVPVPVNPEDLLPQYCPLNPDLPDEFKGMSVNQIFEICLGRCIAKGKAEDEENAKKLEQEPQDDDDKKSVCSIVSSEACSEDLPFISSVNVYSMRKREIQRARKKQAAIDAAKGVTQTSSSSASIPEEDTTLDGGGEISFASGNSDPGQGDEPPLFTIRSKKQPIKIVDPKTLQRPDKPKSPKDLANDVEFLKRGLRVLSTGAELTSQSHKLFKAIGMDGTVLAQTSEWCRYVNEFVRTTSGTLQNLDNLKKVEMRNAIFEQVGQCMGHKKKMDNSILGWTNFAISMFVAEGSSDGKETPPGSTEGVKVEIQSTKEKTSPKVKHSHNKSCQDLNHDLENLTEDNKLKFTTLLRMLIDSLSECKDWILKAPSYAKAKPLRYTELKPIEGLPVPSIEVEAPSETKQGKQAEQVAKKETTENFHKATTAENVGKQTTVQEVEIKEHVEQGLPAELNQQAYYHAQQAVNWYQSGYVVHGFGPRPGGEFIPHPGGQVHRPHSGTNQQMNHDGYQQIHHGNYQPELMGKQVHRSQHNVSRGRQGTRSGGQSRQPSTAGGARQNYGNGHVNSHVNGHVNNHVNGHVNGLIVPHSGPQFTTFVPAPAPGDFLYNPETSTYQEIRYPFTQAQGVHQQPVLQHPQPWRTIATNDGTYLEANHVQPFVQTSVNARVTPDIATTSGEYTRQDRSVAHTAPSQQRSMTVTPQVMQHPGIMHAHHGGNDQYGGGNGMIYSQGVNGMYPGYGHTVWHSQNGHPMQQSQQQSAQGRSGKNVMYQQYGHHPGQYR
ncbi:hypothetical protein TWF730_006976 [Orbilia blumenaviensis]|uniref:Uncharacterized protein n=1 Tax=Orbilia blumenaviensis TaxID=1796055 RepID=A0AAV9VFV9_9PEZI